MSFCLVSWNLAGRDTPFKANTQNNYAYYDLLSLHIFVSFLITKLVLGAGGSGARGATGLGSGCVFTELQFICN